MGQGNSVRIPRMLISPLDSSVVHKKNPWLVMWWSAALPGLGHLCQGFYFKCLVLMSWEIFINFKAHLNTAILYTFTGDFNRAAEVIVPQWLVLYGVVFCFGIFDSFRLGTELNILARVEKMQGRHHYEVTSITSTGFNFINPGNPWAAAAWSALLPGFGHIYNNKSIKGLIVLGWAVAIIYFSRGNYAVIDTLTGKFAKINDIVNYQWLLFFPSIYVFSIWDSYNDTVEMNKLFAEQQKKCLVKKYGLERSGGFSEPAVEH